MKSLNRKDLRLLESAAAQASLIHAVATAKVRESQSRSMQERRMADTSTLLILSRELISVKEVLWFISMTMVLVMSNSLILLMVLASLRPGTR